MTDQKPVISPWRTDFENAPSPCIGWCTTPAGDDVRQIWRHSHLKDQWTAHSITQTVKAWQPLPSIDGSAAADVSAYIPDIVKNAMLTMWNYICDDSKHHPLDIEHGRAKLLTFEPKHWAQFTGEMVQRNIRDLFAPQPSVPAQAPKVTIKPMELSGGRTEYFVSIQVGDREVTPHVFREEFKAAYHVALYYWLLNGSGEEPDIIEFGPHDWPARAVPRIDITNHHNAILCPYCNPNGLKFEAVSLPSTTCGGAAK